MIKRKLFARKSLFIPAIVVVLLIGYAGTAKYQDLWPFTQKTSINPDAIRNNTDNPSPKNNNPPSKADSSATATDGQTSDQVPVDTTLTASITQLEETNNTVKFAATVQHATSAGSCVVTFSNPNDRPVTQQFTATNANNVSTCGPITISANEFSYLGKWNVSFHYYVGDTQATATSEITIQ
jgi:cytoskeletal protein RodZ